MIIPEQGVFSFNYRGTYDSTTDYDSNDAVRGSDGKLYVAVEDNVPQGTDPVGAARYWAEATSSAIPRGREGPQGEKANAYRVVFYESETRPFPSGAAYDGTTFTPPTGSLDRIPNSPTLPIWQQWYELRNDLSPAQLDDLGIANLDRKGDPGQVIRGIDGTDGRDGRDAVDGQDGEDGDDGKDGTSSIIIYRKSLASELLSSDRPTVTYDGTNLLTGLNLPNTDNNAWQLEPYHSKMQGSWALHPDNTNPVDVDIDEAAGIVYVLDAGRKRQAGPPVVPKIIGRVYRYNLSDGSYVDRWDLDTNNEDAIGFDVQGSLVRVVDTEDRGTNPNQYNQVYVYSKTDGGRQNDIEFTVPRAGSYVLRGISTEGNSIYILTEQSIRRFRLSDRTEVSPPPLSDLRSDPPDLANDNVNPQGSDANEHYLFIVDATQRKVFTRDINTLSLRHEYREWSLDSRNGAPIGIGVAERQVLVVDTADLAVYRYYYPENILWGSTLTINENTPYDVTSTAPYDMTALRGDTTISVQGTGTGQDGMDGTNGNETRPIYREVAVGTNIANIANRPSGGTYSNGSYTTPPANWHLTGQEAVDAFSGEGILFQSNVRLSGDGNTILSYSIPFRVSGPVGPAGAVSAAGNSATFIFRVGTITPPTLPSGGTFIAATRIFTPPQNWSIDPPSTIADDQYLYVVAVTLPGQGTDGSGTIAYHGPTQMPKGTQGRKGDDGDPSTVPGPAGTAGRSFTMMYRESATRPDLPTGGTWDGRTFRPPTGWSLDTPTRTDNDPEALYATGVELPGGGGAPHYTGIIEQSGRDGGQGPIGVQGIRGAGTELIFQVATTIPDTPDPGSGSWNHQTGAYTPPGGWSLDPGAYTGNQHLYASKVELPGDSNTETYRSVVRISGLDGHDGTSTITPGQPGAGNGDSLAAIFRTSTTPGDTTIIGHQPSGGTRSGNNLTAAPSGWSLSPPSSVSRGTYVYMAVADLSGDGSTITYYLPIMMSGWPGTDGRPGGTGPAGLNANTVGFIYTRAATIPTAPLAGSGQFFARTALTMERVVVPGWSTNPDDPSLGSSLLWVVPWSYDPNAQTNQLLYGAVSSFHGEAGQRGRTGPAGPGTAGTGQDGSSTINMYRPSSTPLRSIPTGGTWVRATHTFTPPSGWYDTVAQAEDQGSAGDAIYAVAVYLSGTADVINAYSHPLRMTGIPGRDAPHTQVQYSISGGDGTYATNIQNPYFIRFSTDGGVTWAVGHRMRLDGTDGTPGRPGRDGKFVLPIFRNSATRPALPSGLSYSNGVIHGLPPWTREAPDPVSGQDLWVSPIEINPVDGAALAITVYETGSGEDGTDGRDGDSQKLIFHRGTSVPSAPSGGTWNGNDYDPPATWVESYPTSGSGDVYASVVTLSGTNKTNSGISYDTVWRFSSRDGTNGTNGNGTQEIYRRSSAVVSGIPSATGVTVTNGRLNNAPTNWHLIDPGGTVDLYRSTANIQPDGTVTFSRAFKATGNDGFSYQKFYIASTSDSVSQPNVDYNGSAFSNFGSWAMIAPTSPAGSNVFVLNVRYQRSVANSEVEEGVILVGTVPGTAPPSGGAQAYPFSYGIAVRGTHAIQAQQFGGANPAQPSLTLAPGDSGSYNVVIRNSASHLDYYFDLPDGLNLVGVYDTGVGVAEDTSNWQNLDTANPRRYIRARQRRGDADYHLRVTVMRPSN